MDLSAFGIFKLVIVVVALVALAVIFCRATGWRPPRWFVEVLIVLAAAVVVIVAGYIIISL